MAHSDTIADLLTRLRNAAQAKHRYVDMRSSRTKLDVLRVLEQQGFLEHLLLNEAEKKVRIFLKYDTGREPLLQGLKRISRPGCRKYVGADEIPRVFGGMGIVVLSTSRGVLDGATAMREHVGGELICSIW